jgi:hypothetical protein
VGKRVVVEKEATMFRPLLAAALVAVFVLPAAASGNPIVPQLTANVTRTSITLVNADGKKVRVLQPNTYRIVVRDRTRAQNFHLVGPGLNTKTKIAGKTTATWRVYLQPGSYSYRSDRNARLRGTFVVAGSPPA